MAAALRLGEASLAHTKYVKDDVPMLYSAKAGFIASCAADFYRDRIFPRTKTRIVAACFEWRKAHHDSLWMPKALHARHEIGSLGTKMHFVKPFKLKNC